MNVSEMQIAFKFRLDKLDSLNYPNFEPEEIDLLLNQAQNAFVKQRYGINNLKRTSFEETQKRTEDLKSLIKNASLAPIVNDNTNITSNAVSFILPVDYWINIQERVIVSGTSCDKPLLIIIDGQTLVEISGKILEVRPTQHVDFDKTIGDAFKAPDEEKVLRLMFDNKIEIIPAIGQVVKNYRLRYIKKPVPINITTSTNCELPELVHDEIINLAVQIALEGMEAKRTNTFTPVVVSNEE